MSVKLRLEIRSRINNRAITAKVLVSTGFTSESLDLAIPLQLAKELGLWLPLQFMDEEKLRFRYSE